jgi:hypothetical protein
MVFPRHGMHLSQHFLEDKMVSVNETILMGEEQDKDCHYNDY